MVHKELSKQELLNEKLAHDAEVDARYEAWLCGYCKMPVDSGELICSECFDEIFGTTSTNGEGDASPPKKGNDAVDGTDSKDDDEEEDSGLCYYERYVQGK